MKKIFAVSSGSYSDYRIMALFSTEKKAREFMASVHDSDYNEIEMYELDPPAVNLIRRGYSVWNIHMLINGDTERVIRTRNSGYDIESADTYTIWERSKAPAYKGTGIPDILTAMVWAKTETQAIKIVNDRRGQMIAEGKWK